jgi:ribosomal protein L11 methyltransferase
VIDHILAIELEDPADEELIQSRLFLTASTGNTTTGSTSTRNTVEAYFDSPTDRDAAVELLREFACISIDRERRDWLELYQQSLQPLFIGARFVVVPDASLLPEDSQRLTLIVPQEQAFGTGSHETTWLCIELLESLPLSSTTSRTRGLDVGAGSGILALAMHRLGAHKVIAFDNDNDAYGALRDNRIRNSVPETAMPIFIGGVEALSRSTTRSTTGGTFDVVTMNIIPEVIIPLLGDITARVADHGRLLLSGILVTRRDDVVNAARAHGFVPVSERTKGEWWAGVLQRAG